MKRLKGNNAGFTLVELNVSLVIFVIVAAFSLTLLLFAGGIFSNSRQKTEAAKAAADICGLISAKLETASCASCEENLPESYDKREDIYTESLIFTEEGLFIEREEDYRQALFSDLPLEVSVTCRDDAAEIVTVRVEINDDEGKLLYGVSQTVRLLNYKDDETDAFSFDNKPVKRLTVGFIT